MSYNTEQKLNGKIALITGSSSGIGKAVALLFAKQGATVIITSNKNFEGGEAVLKEVQAVNKNANHLHIQGNLGKQWEVQIVFETIEKIYGKLDILINNAGKATAIPFDSITEENLEDELSSNYKSAVWCSQFAHKLMKEKGWIVNTSSIRGMDYAGRQGIIPYSNAKAAVSSLTKTMAAQLAPNIFVNAVLPGFVYTPNYEKNKPELNQKFIEGTLIKRYITTDEIAEAYLFLVTQQYITGTLLLADGGATILGR